MTTSNDDLAKMIKEGFDGVDHRFDQVDQRLEKIEGQILAEHERRIRRIEDALVIPKER